VKKSGPVAIVGGGLSGLSCAQALTAAGISVRVFERSGTVGGRCATQLWQGHLVDIGVQYFTARSGEFKKELLTRLRQFRPIVSPVFDQDGKSIPSLYGPRFYVLQGNNYFAHILSNGVEIRLKTEVDKIGFRGGEVQVLGETYRAVVCAMPGPQTATLLGLADTPAEYDPCLVVMLEYGGKDLGNARECYGRLLAKGDPIQATFCENNKVGRIVGTKTVFIVEASPRYSAEFAGRPSEDYLPELVRRHEEIWQIPSGQLIAASGHFWKFARPAAGKQRRVPLPTGAFLCGDSRTESTVEDVWLDGHTTAQEVIAYLHDGKKK
jgi:predicted NAD/FAD-dependent oxidoreductase